MFCACSFHDKSMNNLLSFCGLVDGEIRASDKDLPVTDPKVKCFQAGKLSPVCNGQEVGHLHAVAWRSTSGRLFAAVVGKKTPYLPIAESLNV